MNSLIIDFLRICAQMILLLIVSILIHEFAHWWALKRITKHQIDFHFSWKGIKIGNPQDYKELTGEQYRLVIGAGVFSGAIILIIISNHNGLLALATLLLYTIGCKGDIKNYYKSKQTEKDEAEK